MSATVTWSFKVSPPCSWESLLGEGSISLKDLIPLLNHWSDHQSCNNQCVGINLHFHVLLWMWPPCPTGHEYIKVPFGLMQAPAYFQELMTGVLKDFSFTTDHLDDIIISSRTAEEHLNHIKQIFEKLRNTHLSMKLNKCHFITKEIQYLRNILSTKGIRPLPSKTKAINNMHPTKNS